MEFCRYTSRPAVGCRLFPMTTMRRGRSVASRFWRCVRPAEASPFSGTRRQSMLAKRICDLICVCQSSVQELLAEEQPTSNVGQKLTAERYGLAKRRFRGRIQRGKGDELRLPRCAVQVIRSEVCQQFCQQEGPVSCVFYSRQPISPSRQNCSKHAENEKNNYRWDLTRMVS